MCTVLVKQCKSQLAIYLQEKNSFYLLLAFHSGSLLPMPNSALDLTTRMGYSATITPLRSPQSCEQCVNATYRAWQAPQHNMGPSFPTPCDVCGAGGWHVQAKLPTTCPKDHLVWKMPLPIRHTHTHSTYRTMDKQTVGNNRLRGHVVFGELFFSPTT